MKASKVGRSRGISVWAMVEVGPFTRSSRNSIGAAPSTMLKWPSGSSSLATVKPPISVLLPEPVEPLTTTKPPRGR